MKPVVAELVKAFKSQTDYVCKSKVQITKKHTKMYLTIVTLVLVYNYICIDLCDEHKKIIPRSKESCEKNEMF